MGKFLKGLFAGGLVGAIAGLLMAPKKGEETRKKLSEISDDLSGRFKEISKEAKQKYEEIREKVSEAKEDDEAKFT